VAYEDGEEEEAVPLEELFHELQAWPPPASSPTPAAPPPAARPPLGMPAVERALEGVGLERYAAAFDEQGCNLRR